MFHWNFSTYEMGKNESSSFVGTEGNTIARCFFLLFFREQKNTLIVFFPTFGRVVCIVAQIHKIWRTQIKNWGHSPIAQ